MERCFQITITVNPDGTFRIETVSPSYEAATFGDAVGWFAEKLLYEQQEAQKQAQDQAAQLEIKSWS